MGEAADAAAERSTGSAATSRRPRRRLLRLLVTICASAAVAALLWQFGDAESVEIGMATSHLDRLSAGGAGLQSRKSVEYRFAHQFATKTAYWEQRAGRAEARELVEGLNQRVFRPDLELVQTQIVTRHGIRFPTAGNIKEIQMLLGKLRPYSEKLPRWLQNYSLPYNLSVEGALAEPGRQEMRDMAARTLVAMDRQTPIKYSDKFRLAHTTARRTSESAIAFASAFFSDPQDVHYIEYPESNDTLLRFFDLCPRYQREVKTNKSAIAQAGIFKESKIMQDEVVKMQASLSLEDEEVSLTAKDLSSIFSACAFDFALYNITQNWCSLMTSSFASALDFSDDLKEFYLIGGGYKINYEMAALLLREIFSNMRSARDGTASLEGVFFFSHAETTLPLMTLLGLSDRTPLLGSFSPRAIKARGFRTSRLAPFAANIEFRLFRRASEKPADVVQIFLNGKQIRVPGCSRMTCSIMELEDLWRFYLQDYDFKRDCK